MRKKWIGFLIVLVLLCTAIAALAAAPSKTTKDLVKVTKTVLATGEEDDALVWVKETPSDLVAQQLAAITTFSKQEESVVNYFTDDVQLQVSALLPEGKTPADLIMSEFTDLGIGDYQPIFGDVTCTFSFATEFEENQTLVALVGYLNENNVVVWTAFPAIVVDGQVQIVLPSDFLLIAGHEAILSILSE